MDYDELVQKNIAKEISDLEFLLAQKRACFGIPPRNGSKESGDQQ